MKARRTPGIVYNHQIPEARALVDRLLDRLRLGPGSLVCTLDQFQEMQKQGAKPAIDLVVTVGGDGTILRVAHAVAAQGLAILGINLGRVGFMTELSVEDALENIQTYLDNDLWVEERAMVQARVVPALKDSGPKRRRSPAHHALNEVVVGSNRVSRMATVGVAIDGVPLTSYRANSVIVATATGSTAYALSAGGPILYPLSRDMVLVPAAPHLSMFMPLVLPPTSRIELTVLSELPAIMSVDGMVDVELKQGDRVEVQASPRVTRFLRAHPPSYYYGILTRRLGMEQWSLPRRATSR